MSEWVSQTEIVAHLGYKILIAGLSEAGKTAVKRIFFLKQRTEDVNSLSATLNYERLSITINDLPITIVDLGGQKIFLQRFLSSFSPFIFSSVQTFIFLIDVSNKTSRNNSIAYFKACLEKLNNFSPETEIFVFLHKNDLVINSPNYESIHEQLKEQFQIEVAKKIRFFRTTIYKPETIINAFGRLFELTVPTIARSEFVDGRTIGEIEELHKLDMTLRQPTPITEEMNDVILAEKTEIQPKMAGDPAVLEKLKFLMREAVETNVQTGKRAFSKISYNSVALGKAATEESSSETVLTHVGIQDPTDIATEIPIRPPIEKQPLDASDTTNIMKETILKDDVAAEEPPVLEPLISHLIEYYQIDDDKAVEIMNSGYSDVFELAVTSGIPVSLVLDVILKYLPFVKKSQDEETFKKISNERLTDLFFVYLKGDLKEEDIVKCLVIMVEREKMSTQEIVKKYFTPDKIKVKKRKKEKKKDIIISERTVSELNVTVEAETADGVINFPNTQGIGFKIDLIEPENINARVSFYLQGSMGQKELIGSSVVSSSISSEELLYLLAYELNLSNLGYFEDGIGAMNFAARIIHQTLEKMSDSETISSNDLSKHVTRTDKAKYLTEMIDFIIPMEIEADGEFILIPDSESVEFNVEKGNKGMLISFTQRGFPIGHVNVTGNIQLPQLRRLIKEAIPLPIESDGAIDFSSRIMLAIIDNIQQTGTSGLMKSSERVPLKQEEKSVDVKDDKDTSDQLKKYLSLLEDE
ncbi:MAG: ADP-ribosylation factor-like protein [Candidatus Hodarchaeales archaeon]|jgi:GTPase SAR1 family protein